MNQRFPLQPHSLTRSTASGGGGITASGPGFGSFCSHLLLFSGSVFLVNSCSSRSTRVTSQLTTVGSRMHGVSLPLKSGFLFSTANPRSPSSARVSPHLCRCPHSPRSRGTAQKQLGLGRCRHQNLGVCVARLTAGPGDPPLRSYRPNLYWPL